MNIPKVKFKLADINFETSMIYYFLFPFRGTSKIIYKRHKKLKNLLKTAKNKKERLRIIRNYSKNFWKDNIKELEENSKLFKKEWSKINDKYMITLSQVLETNWPVERKNIIAFVSINPIYPRFLKNWSFSIFGLQKNIKRLNEIIAHEILHFLYFKKWKEVFPNSNERTFDIPYLEWNLSEILAPVILSNPRIQTIIKQKPIGYPEHKKIKINKKTVIKHFGLIYRKSLKEKEPFGEFLKKSYKEAKKHKDLIKWKSA